MSSKKIYCLSLQLEPSTHMNENYEDSNSNKMVSVAKDSTTNTATDETLRSSAAIIKTITTSQNSNANMQQQQSLQQHQPQQQHHSNIIFFRGSRNENGQIILQNSHELLSLINDDDSKQIVIQQTKSATSSTNNCSNATTTTTPITQTTERKTQRITPILLQTPIKSSQLENGTVLLQSANIKKNLIPERSIILQQKINKNIVNGNNNSNNGIGGGGSGGITSSASITTTTAGVPFLLQTLKRLDKSQSILVFRNPAPSSSSSSSTATTNNGNSNSLTTVNTGGTITSLTPSLTVSSSPSISLSKLSGSSSSSSSLTFKSSSTSTTTSSGSGITNTAQQLKAAFANKFSKSATICRISTSTNTNNKNSNSSGISIGINSNHKNNQNNSNNNHHHHTSHNQNLLNVDNKVLDDIQNNKLDKTINAGQQQQQQQQQTQQQKNHQQMNVPLGADGEPIKLPENLESLPRADHFPSQRHRWNTNEEIAAILISFDKHSEWQSKEVRTRPKSGSLLLYSRKKVRYRRDGYCWKKRKDGKTTREDHMKLKVQGTECIYGCYVHSAILPTFHRRCYWLLQNPDIVLVHYLNVPYPDDNKMAVITPSLSLWGDKKEWTKEELVSQLKPMLSTVFSEDDSDSGNDIEISTAETVETIVGQLMEKQRLARQAALVKQLECGCPDSTCADSKSCSHQMRRIGSLKSVSHKRQENNQVSSTTPNGQMVGPRMYSRWVDKRSREAIADMNSKTLENSVKFQIVPSINNNHHLIQQQQQQHQQHHLNRHHNNNSGNLCNEQTQTTQQFMTTSNSNQVFANASNQTSNQLNRIGNNNNNNNNNNGNNISQIIINSNHSNSNNNNNNISNSITTAITTATTQTKSVGIGGVGGGVSSNVGQNLTPTNSNNAINSNNNRITNNNIQLTSNHSQQQHITLQTSNNQRHQHQQQQQQQQQQQHNNSNNASVLTQSSSSLNEHHMQLQQSQQQQQQQQHCNSLQSSSSQHQQQQQQQQQQHLNQQQQHSSHHLLHHQQTIIDGNVVNQRASSSSSSSTSSSNSISNNNNCRMTISNGTRLLNDSTNNNNVATSTPSLVLNLSQHLQSSGRSLLILNSNQQQHQPQHQQHQQQQHHQSFVCQTSPMQQQQSSTSQRKDAMLGDESSSSTPNLIPKEEEIDSNTTSSDKQMDCSYNTIAFSSNHPSTSENSKDCLMTKELSDSLSFFNETLDLSQEDIQKTLIANMPLTRDNRSNMVGHDEEIDTDINPMDFIDNVCDGTAVNNVPIGNNSTVIPNVHETDDVFVNLDVFDMLVEFPELELDDRNAFSHDSFDETKTTPESSASSESFLTKDNSPGQTQMSITDYSPEWAYTEGGVKVLVTGPWKTTSTYQVLFDSFPVPTTVVQDGVLRCYCPAHEVGLATLQVACDNFVISNSVVFEYKSPPNAETACEGSTNDSLYKFTLLNRLSSIDEQMQIKTEPKDVDQVALFSQSNFEERLVNYCQLLTNKTWRSMTPGSWSIGYHGMTLLHLASALGYSKLVLSMLTWRSENPNVILETEIDALSQDIKGLTPLAWACTRGHLETAVILYKWNHNSLKIKNNLQQTPLDVAKAMRHSELINQLEKLENDRNEKHQRSSLSISKDFNENTTSSVFDLEDNKIYTLHSLNDDCDVGQKMLRFSDNMSDNIGKISRSHDGVFLRPGAVPTSNQSPSNNLRLIKRPSIDSGINMDIRSISRTGKLFRDQNKYHSYDANDAYSLSSDSVFSDNLNSSGMLSPLRKKDFALCEVTACSSDRMLANKSQKSTSPSLSSPNGEIGGFAGSSGGGGGGGCGGGSGIFTELRSRSLSDSVDDVVVGESDAKVLTLAEHIIAAMPDRIKNESEDLMIVGSPTLSETLSTETSGICDSFMDPLLDSLPNGHFDSDFSFELSDQNYRYNDVSTPCSSLSPASSGPLQSPASYSVPPDPQLNSPSPPPSTKELTEFLHASCISQRPFEADFSKLTLTDSEQRELYEAAKCIQKAYRSYKGRKKLEEQDKERSAAIVIQNYYRRYKQYAYFRQMTHAALVIQNGYRSYCANKRFKKSQVSSSPLPEESDNSHCLKTYYDNYRNDQQQGQLLQSTVPKEASPSGPLKRTYSQRTQNQAARKIQQFMRQSKLNIWDGNLEIMTAERTSRKREAGAPTQGGVPSKLSVSRTIRNITPSRTK